MKRSTKSRGRGLSRRWEALRTTVVLAALPAMACSIATDLGRPTLAKVELTGPGSASMEVVTSNNFFVVDQSVSFVTADTTTVSLPLSHTYRLDTPARFYFMAVNTGESTETFSLRIWIEEASWYDESKILAPGEKFEFVYRYNEPGIT